MVRSAQAEENKRVAARKKYNEDKIARTGEPVDRNMGRKRKEMPGHEKKVPAKKKKKKTKKKGPAPPVLNAAASEIEDEYVDSSQHQYKYQLLHSDTGVYVNDSDEVYVDDSEGEDTTLEFYQKEAILTQPEEIPLSQPVTPSPLKKEIVAKKKSRKKTAAKLVLATKTVETIQKFKTSHAKSKDSSFRDSATWTTDCGKSPPCTLYTVGILNKCCCTWMNGVAPFPGLPCGTTVVFGHRLSPDSGAFVGAVKAHRATPLQCIKEWSQQDKATDPDRYKAEYDAFKIEINAKSTRQLSFKSMDGRQFRAPTSGLILCQPMYRGYRLRFVQDSEIHMMSGRPIVPPSILDPSEVTTCGEDEPISKALREAIFNRGKKMCMCCGGKLVITMREAILHNCTHAPGGPFVQVMHASHGLARSLGGPADLENLFACCGSTYSSTYVIYSCLVWRFSANVT